MKQSQITVFRDQLITWFEANKRDLPWRRTDDPYSIWVSEVMLQQTQVKIVLDYYERFLESFPTVIDLSQADLQLVLKSWEGMGYYARARNLHQASGIVRDKFDGQLPRDQGSFRSLPGAGEYITAAVLSRAFDKPLAVVDGNVKRVLSRLFMIDEPINSANANRQFAEHASTMLDPQRPGQFNEAMMELGATICTPKNPNCKICPVSNFCESYIQDRQRDYPVTAIRKAIPHHHLVVSVICKDDKILIVRRPLSGLLGGLWELPGGEIEKNETGISACSRIIKDSTNLDIETPEQITRVKHAYSHFSIEIDVYRSRYKLGDVYLKDHIDYRWINWAETDDYAFHQAHRKIFNKLTKG
ncbi:A/G-specific adenine glycosylase [candidate division KSB1 bacterium]|nr:A/G-specific adenine glycosylase [candidate division KSB1 bacterium]